MATSPTQLSLKRLRQDGYTAAVLEHWNPFAHIRQDLWGFADLIAFKAGEPVVLVQTTTTSNQAARVRKIKENDTAAHWLKCGHHIHVHGWRKDKKSNRWRATVTHVELPPPG